MKKLAIGCIAMALLAGCANENGAVPLNRDTWTPNAKPRGERYDPYAFNASTGSEGVPQAFQAFCLDTGGDPAAITDAVTRSGRYLPPETVGRPGVGSLVVFGRRDNQGAVGYAVADQPGAFGPDGEGCFVGEGDDVWTRYADGRVAREPLA